MSGRTTGIVVMGYGLYDPDLRSPKEMRGYKRYLDSCWELIKDHQRQGDLATVILAGGYTNPARPLVSEGDTMYKYLLARFHEDQASGNAADRLPPNMITDHAYWGWNTTQNIVHAVKIFGRYGDIKKRIVCCDTARRGKVKAICFWLNLLRGARLEVEAFDREDIHPHSEPAFQKRQEILYWIFGPILIWRDLRFEPPSVD